MFEHASVVGMVAYECLLDGIFFMDGFLYVAAKKVLPKRNGNTKNKKKQPNRKHPPFIKSVKKKIKSLISSCLIFDLFERSSDFQPLISILIMPY